MASVAEGPKDAPARYRAFISYRRQDAGGLARWLRRRLIEFSIPASVLAKLSLAHRRDIESRRGFFLDTSYVRAKADWWRDNILPALRQSDYLIVVSSPTLSMPRSDGSRHVVDQEIDAWREMHGDQEAAKRIIPIVTGSLGPKDLPLSLAALGSAWDIVDLRKFSMWHRFQPGAIEQLERGVLAIVSGILELPQDCLPELLNEEARRRGRWRLLYAGIAAAVIAVLSGVSIWALTERDRAETATARALDAQSVAERERNQALVQESRTVSRRAVEVIRAGDAQSGMLAALSVLPTSTRLRPPSPEAAFALYEGWLWNREVATLNGHTGRVLDAAYSFDGKRIVTASEDSTAAVWDVSNFKRPIPVMLAGHEKAVFKASFSRDGRRILTLSHDGTARVWEVDRPAKSPLVIEVPDATYSVFAGRDDGRIPIMQAMFSDSGDVIATRLRNGAVQVWDVTGTTPTRLPSPHNDLDEQRAASIVLRGDGRRLFIGMMQGGVQLWNLEANPPEKVEWRGHRWEIRDASLSPDGAYLLTSSIDGEVRLWSFGVQDSQSQLIYKNNEIVHIGFSGDSRQVLIISNDEAAVLDVADLKQGRKSPHLGLAGGELRPGHKSVLTFDNGGRLALTQWLGSTIIHTPVGFHDRHVSSAVFSPDGNYVVSASSDGTARIWDVSSHRPSMRAFSHSAETIATVGRFSFDGQRIVTVSNGAALIWDFGSGSSIPRQISYGGYWITEAAFSSNERHIVTKSIDGRVRVWSIDGKSMTSTELNESLRKELPRREWPKPEGAYVEVIGPALSTMSFALDHPSVVIEFSRKGSWVWSLSHEPPLPAVLPLRREQAVARVHDRGGGSIIATSTDEDAEFWDFAREWPASKEWADPIRLAGLRGEVAAAALSTDRRRLFTASKSGEAWLWNLTTSPASRTPWPGHRSVVHTAAFSEDGNSLVTSSADGTVKIWATKSHPPTAVTVEVDAVQNGIDLTHDGSHMLTISPDGSVRIWAAKAQPPVSVKLVERTTSTASLSRNGRRVAATHHSHLMLFPMFDSVEALIDEARRTLTRCLGDAERYKFGLPSTAESMRGGGAEALPCK